MNTARGVPYGVVARSTVKRREDLLPLRREIDSLISQLGWKRARPIVERYIGVPAGPSQRGAWWSRVGKRNGEQLRKELLSEVDRRSAGKLF
jgi:hypothetical protein